MHLVMVENIMLVIYSMIRSYFHIPLLKH